jgi:hypothetical protein
MLTSAIDPEIIRILFSPLEFSEILGERKAGVWTEQTRFFPIVESTGEVTSYDDYATGGRAGANFNYPQLQSYLFQTILQYGELQIDRAGLAKINWVSELGLAAADLLNRFQNITYAYGVQNLQNYGILNDPNLTASLTPGPKAFGNNQWITGTVVTATANEIFADIQSLFLALVNQTFGLVNNRTKVVLALSPASRMALTATNSFNVNVETLLKNNFPNIRVEDAVQYGGLSASNPQGYATGGFIVQMIAESVEGQETGTCAYSEKMRSHPIIRAVSSFKQKVTSGTWGAVVRQPTNIATMIGI